MKYFCIQCDIQHYGGAVVRASALAFIIDSQRNGLETQAKTARHP